MTKNEIISQLFTGKNLCDCIGKMEPDHLREDLKMEVILIICELSEEKILGLHYRKELEFYTVRVILNQVKNLFAKKYRVRTEEYIETDDYDTQTKKDYSEAIDNEAIINEERQLREDIEDMAIKEVDKLHWYNKGLVALYMKHGNYRAIQEETGIPFGSCYKTIRKSLNQIKETVNKPVF